MKIDKFKLINGGFDGIEVWRTEPVRKGNLISLDQVHRIRKVQLERNIRDMIQSLRYFYLALTRHWVEPFNQYFDFENYKPKPIEEISKMKSGERLMRALWNDTFVTGVSVRETGFVIMGFIEVLEGKKLGIATPFVTQEDDFVFYNEAMEMISKIHEEINRYLYHNILPLNEAREQFMLETGKKSLTEKEEKELLDKLVDKLQEAGAIVMMNDENYQEALVAPENAVEIHQSKNLINKDRYEEPEEIKEEQIIFQENRGKIPSETIVGQIPDADNAYPLLEDEVL